MLGADVHGEPGRDQSGVPGCLQYSQGVRRGAAELPAQAPECPLAGGGEAAEHPCARRVFGDREDIGQAVGGEVAHADPVRLGDLAVGLDRVAVVDPLDRHAGAQRLDDLLRSGRVEAGAPCGQAVEHLVHRAGLHGEPDLHVRQFAPQGVVLGLDAVEVVDDPVVLGGGQGGAQTSVVRHGRHSGRWWVGPVFRAFRCAAARRCGRWSPAGPRPPRGPPVPGTGAPKRLDTGARRASASRHSKVGSGRRIGGCRTVGCPCEGRGRQGSRGARVRVAGQARRRARRRTRRENGEGDGEGGGEGDGEGNGGGRGSLTGSEAAAGLLVGQGVPTTVPASSNACDPTVD